MLGNFAFGDYFKEQAIPWAWELMNKVYKIPKERMYVTIFEGDADVPRDEASEKIWQKLGLSLDMIKTAGRKDNFWGPTGDEGPCGPTTEIYVDGLEVWNNVFNEYYCHPGGKLEKLKNSGVDTGMGLERLVLRITGVKSPYDTDLFAPIMAVIKARAGAAMDLKALRILADHLRSSCFLIADGVRPSNVKQGYILRRLIRRSVRYERLLNLKSDYINEVIAKVGENFGEIYPEVKTESANILKVVNEERGVFEKAIGRGLKMFEKTLQASGGKFTGEDAFKLYESYGFPYELVEELAAEKDLKLQRADFDAAFAKHQEKSRPK